MKLTSKERKELLRLITKLLDEENEPKPKQATTITGGTEPPKTVDLEEVITEHIQELAIPAHIKGYQYLRMAIKMCMEDSKKLSAKHLYPEIAKLCETTPSRVERAIRHAIEVSHNRCKQYVMDEIFADTIDPEKRKPTNSEFIATLVEHIRIKHLRL